MDPSSHYQQQYPGYSSPSTISKQEGWFDWAYKGVDHTLPGNGGPQCRDFLSLSQRCWESAMASAIGLLALFYAYPRIRLPVPCPSRYACGEPIGKRILLLLMCLTFGIELGFKFSTRQMIWLGNPCHLATMMQIFILAAPPSRIVTAAFRLHMHMLTGAPIAILFPVINTRLLPFETGVYFLQHILMLIIPFYLMKTGDPFIPEELLDFKWAFVSFGFLYIYHFLPLQFLAYHSQVNLNNMLCPAVSDPFHGKYYRLFAICHQIILIPTLGKIFVIIAKAFCILPNNDLPDAPLNEVFSGSCQSVCNDCPPEPPTRCPSPCCCQACCPSVNSYDSTKKCLSACGNKSITGSCDGVRDSGMVTATGCCDKNIDRNLSPYSPSMGGTASGYNLYNDSKTSLEQAGNYQSYGKDSSYDNEGKYRNTLSTTLTTASPAASGRKSEGDYDSGSKNYVTRRLVNGKVSCDLPPYHPKQQEEDNSCSQSGCGVHRGSRSGSRKKNSDSFGPMSMSELDGRNGHAKPQ